jgi:hypothetical protein
MKKLIISLFSLIVISAHAEDSAKAGHNDGGKKDASMETKSTADHSGQTAGPSEGNPDGKKKSTKQGPRSMQNTMPGTNSTPPPHN